VTKPVTIGYGLGDLPVADPRTNALGPSLEGYWWDIIFAPHATDRVHKGAPWGFF
jgi:hypothetical protein